MPTRTGKDNYNNRVFLGFCITILCIVGTTFFCRVYDTDFFWHLATGRWIVENLTLPERDPFTTFFYDSGREALILKGYWLTQICYQIAFAAGGMVGVALLKSSSFVALFGTTLYFHWKKKTNIAWVFLLMLPLYETLLHFRADRPNMVSLLFFAFLIYLLETKRWKFLPLLMLVWANSHAGYLLGNVVIIIYVGALVLSRQKKVLTPASWGLAGVVASFANPLGAAPVLSLINFQGSALQKGNLESMSPIQIALDYHDYYLGYFLAVFFIIVCLFLIRRSSAWEQLAVLILTAFISLTSARYMPFLVIASAFYVPCIFERINLPVLWRRGLLCGSITLIILLGFNDLSVGRGLTWGLEPDRFPVKGAEFIARSGGKGQVFCNYEWGGYLIWKLPEAMILNDPRGLSEDAYLKNVAIENASPGWETELIEMNTTVVVVSAFNPLSGKANKLWQSLFYTDNWQLVYADNVSLVYYRNDVAKEGPLMSSHQKQLSSLNHALSQIRHIVEKHPQTPWHWADLGYIHVLRREIPEAITAYRKALSLDPENDSYQTKIKLLSAY